MARNIVKSGRSRSKDKEDTRHRQYLYGYDSPSPDEKRSYRSSGFLTRQKSDLTHSRLNESSAFDLPIDSI